MAESQEQTPNKDNFEHFGFRDGTIFVIDVSPEMFERYPGTENTYFNECLKVYARILTEKLTWNRRDWMGLILYNVTKNWDPDTEHILTVQKFSEIETSMSIQLLDMLKEKTEKEDYCDESLGDKRDRCLHDVLWQASRSFDAIKIAMPQRQVVLLTRNDDPSPSDSQERHKIRLRAKTNRDINVHLRIVGLKDDWDHKLFFRDLDVLANGCEPEDSEPTKLAQLENRLVFAAQTSGNLNWKIGEGLELPVRVTSFSSKSTLKKVRMHKDTNEILEVFRHWETSRQSGDVSDDEESQDLPQTKIPDCIRKGVRYGDRLITFQPKEIKEIRSPLEPGIRLIGFKPVSMDFVDHIKPTKFVGIDKAASPMEKALFAALFAKCQSKSVMAICSVSHRSSPYLAKMIACDKLRGFYLRKIPFREQVNDLTEYTKDYVYDGTDENSVPVDEEGVQIARKIIKKLRTQWEPSNFFNPRTRLQMDYIRTLALDTEFQKPLDNTCPDKDKIRERVGNLVEDFKGLFGNFSAKRPAASTGQAKDSVKEVKFDEASIRSLVKSGKLQQTSVANLRSMARSIGVQTTGIKAQLTERITAHFARNGS